MNCPVCHSDTQIFLSRERVPVNQNVIFRTQREATEAPRGDLRLAVCNGCGFIFNQSFDSSYPMYGDGYDNTQICSPFFESYVDDLVSDLVKREEVRNSHVVEIGCGDGSFLKKLVKAGKNTGYGYDPSYNGPLIGENVKFERSYYQGNTCADVTIARHVLEHIPNPVALLSKVTGRVFIETPCVEWILKNRVVWDFFYEHCSYFSTASLITTLETAGFVVNRVKRVFEGQYIWVDAYKGQAIVSHRIGEAVNLAWQFVGYEVSTVRTLTDMFMGGDIAIWGAGAKGVTLANLVDPACERIPCVVDVNPKKQGGFIAGSGHPIVDYHELPKYGVKAVMLMNPNYYMECANLLYHAHIDVALLGTPKEGARCA